MKLFTRISFILFFVIAVYFTLDIDFYKNNKLIENIVLYISGLIFFGLYFFFMTLIPVVVLFEERIDNYFEIISEDIKLIYKQIKLITKFYLNL